MKRILIPLACCTMLLASCQRTFEPISYGKDACAHCKMSIVDDRYASELITEKGRTYKFDDVLCMKQYLAEQKIAGATMLFVEDYLKQSAAPLNASQAVYLKHEMFTSPMNGNYAAFANAADAERLMDSLNVPALSWENLE